MVVIFGWGGGQAKDLGEIAPTTCPNCHNHVFLHHIPVLGMNKRKKGIQMGI